MLDLFLKNSGITLFQFILNSFKTYKIFLQFQELATSHEESKSDMLALSNKSYEICQQLITAGIKQKDIENICCPLSGFIMFDPVMLTNTDGEIQYFERSQLDAHFMQSQLQLHHPKKWRFKEKTHPLTGQAIKEGEPLSAPDKQAQIQEFLTANLSLSPDIELDNHSCS